VYHRLERVLCDICHDIPTPQIIECRTCGGKACKKCVEKKESENASESCIFNEECLNNKKNYKEIIEND